MSYAEDARTIFSDMLKMLEHLVDKTLAAGLDDGVLSARLTEDMFPLELQFRVAVNQVLIALNRSAAIEVPLDEKPYDSLPHARERIRAARGEVERAGDWIPAESEIDFTLPNGQRYVMTALEHTRDWIMPNFYFHSTMAYALLRREGVPLGKFEFVPHMLRYRRESET